MHLGRQMLQQERQGFVNLRGGDDVIVIKDDGEWPIRLAEIAEQVDEDGLQLRRQRIGKRGDRRFANPAPEGCKRTDKVAQKAGRIVVIVVEGEPRKGKTAASAGGAPFAEQCGLSKSGGRRDQRQRTREPLVQARAETWTRDNRPSQWRYREFCAQQGSRHGARVDAVCVRPIRQGSIARASTPVAANPPDRSTLAGMSLALSNMISQIASALPVVPWHCPGQRSPSPRAGSGAPSRRTLNT